MTIITVDAPFDAHVHFRQEEGGLLPIVVPYHDRVFEYALVMPNTVPPILTSEDAKRYKEQIGKYCTKLKPLMTLKLLPYKVPTSFDEVTACKLYPQVTTNSHDGFSRFDLDDMKESLYPSLEQMQNKGIVLCVHGELPGSFCMNREGDFLAYLNFICWDFPRLRIVLEHITTSRAVQFVKLHSNTAATITLHHLECTLDDVVGDTLKPHNFCKPIAKTPHDRESLLGAIYSRDSRFFLGSDSAPHWQRDKECSSGCAGCFTAPGLLEGLVEVFDRASMLDRLNDFVSTFGRSWYRLPKPSYQLRLEENCRWRMHNSIGFGNDKLIPYAADRTMNWKVIE